MKRRRPKPKPCLSREVAEAVLDRFDYGHGMTPWCACGCGDRATSWHHIFPQQHYPELADEPDNIVPVATRCHERHTNAVRRYPRLIARFAERLAVTPAMVNYLDRTYRSDP